MLNTPNYKLNKPEGNEFVDISALNENADKIDEALTKASIVTDNATGSKYRLGVENGLAFIEQVG